MQAACVPSHTVYFFPHPESAHLENSPGSLNRNDIISLWPLKTNQTIPTRTVWILLLIRDGKIWSTTGKKRSISMVNVPSQAHKNARSRFHVQKSKSPKTCTQIPVINLNTTSSAMEWKCTEIYPWKKISPLKHQKHIPYTRPRFSLASPKIHQISHKPQIKMSSNHKP